MSKILVAGAGGFIGSHLVKRLKDEGNYVIGADLKTPEFDDSPADEFYKVDLRDHELANFVTEGVDQVYQLAADMGGIGYITAHLASIARNNTLINLNMLDAARNFRVKKYLYTSSACVYAHDKQVNEDAVPLKESDAHPADPEPGYGWEKLYAEQMTQYYMKDYGLNARIVRFHNVYGPLGTYDGGKEKSPAALCRKIAKAPDGGVIEVWGDGQQTRTYMYIDDCVEGLIRLMASEYREPLNLGRDELISIDGLVNLISNISGKMIYIQHVDGPQGVRGRSSDNNKCREVLGWEPKIDLIQGLEPTYKWIKEQVNGNTGNDK